ncbi:MAG: type II toxin-antitoxin system prevent-host-death family antitoxin [Rubellimicrobium sp.]|nr:type II toxin-antitoxin system prevent-host-death family antitoxin [Rubellimicrobium sp.]
MKHFPSSAITRDSGELLHSADTAPVAITRYSRPRYVLMTMEHYERLVAPGDTRRSFAVKDMPDDMAALLEKGLGDYLDEA